MRLDLLGDCLQRLEVVQRIDRLHGCEAGGEILVQQCLVVDDTVSLHNVCDAVDLAVLRQCEVVRGQLAEHLATGEVIAVVDPVGKTDGTVDLEQRGRLGLVHLRRERLLIRAGRGSHDIDRNTGLLGIGLRQCFPLGVLFGFEVQIIDRRCVVFLPAGGETKQDRQCSKNQCKCLFHKNALLKKTETDCSIDRATRAHTRIALCCFHFRI